MNTNILDYGAKSDGVTLNTQYIQMAIDKCAESGGGRVTVPCGAFVTGTIYLRDNVELHLEHGAVLVARTNMDDYNELDAYEQNFGCPKTEEWVGKHLIIALEVKNTAITGTGTIDGSGDFFFGEPVFESGYGWRLGIAKARDKTILRPGQLVCFIECEDVTVTDVTLRNTPCWGLFLYGCERVTVRGLKAFSRPYFANTDGIDIDCCRFVTVSDCIINTGDDAIAIRGSSKRLKKYRPCEYVTVSNCVLGSYACAIRVGVGIGDIRHIIMSNITITSGGYGVQLCTDYGLSGCVNIEDVSFTGFSMDNCAWPLKIMENNGARVRDITFDGFNVSAFGSTRLLFAHKDTAENITLKNFTLHLSRAVGAKECDYDKEGKYIFEAKNVNGLCVDGFKIYTDKETLSKWGISDYDGCTRRYERGFEIITE